MSYFSTNVAANKTCSRPIAYCLLPIAYCLLPIAYSLFPIPYSLLFKMATTVAAIAKF
ncbi:MAG: hypothetical protein F6K55_07385 [Moorea sp. SIO4A3]|nr:hypothetical protein [Moorena sp. SIO4A3]